MAKAWGNHARYRKVDVGPGLVENQNLQLVRRCEVPASYNILQKIVRREVLKVLKRTWLRFQIGGQVELASDGRPAPPLDGVASSTVGAVRFGARCGGNGLQGLVQLCHRSDQGDLGVQMSAEPVNDIFLGLIYSPRKGSEGRDAKVARDVERPNFATERAIVINEGWDIGVIKALSRGRQLVGCM
jgi:hypothetical protein